MGIAILGGLTIGTALTLYVVPAVYTYVTSKRLRTVDLHDEADAAA
jgi:multidrug efflux pump